MRCKKLGGFSKKKKLQKTLRFKIGFQLDFKGW